MFYLIKIEVNKILRDENNYKLMCKSLRALLQTQEMLQAAKIKPLDRRKLSLKWHKCFNEGQKSTLNDKGRRQTSLLILTSIQRYDVLMTRRTAPHTLPIACVDRV